MAQFQIVTLRGELLPDQPLLLRSKEPSQVDGQLDGFVLHNRFQRPSSFWNKTEPDVSDVTLDERIHVLECAAGANVALLPEERIPLGYFQARFPSDPVRPILIFASLLETFDFLPDAPRQKR
jgi:hypothetical protein